MHTTFMRPNKRNIRRTLNVLCVQNNAKCLCLSDGHCLKNVNLTVIPPTVRKGRNASLLCQYDLEGAPLYSVKWYRGNFEFYRYSPGEKPAFKIFPYSGIYVDVSIKAKYIDLMNWAFWAVLMILFPFPKWLLSRNTIFAIFLLLLSNPVLTGSRLTCCEVTGYLDKSAGAFWQGF